MSTAQAIRVKHHRAMRFADIAGRRFGKLTAVWPAGRRGKHEACVVVWLCACACGNMTYVVAASLLRRSRNTTSCGCGYGTHHMSYTSEYGRYKEAKSRCTDPQRICWKDYGGRGIRFLFTSFEQFYAELGDCPKGLQLDRINNDGHYEPGNVRWATVSQQARNRRSRIRG